MIKVLFITALKKSVEAGKLLRISIASKLRERKVEGLDNGRKKFNKSTSSLFLS